MIKYSLLLNWLKPHTVVQVGLIILYPIGSIVIYTYMLAQRRKKLKAVL